MNRKIYSGITLLWLVFFLLNHSVCDAQNPGSPNELDKNYVPDPNSVFNAKAGNNTGYDGEVRSALPNRVILEFTPGLLIRNIAALQAETKLSSIFSVQAGFGVAFGKDRLQSIVSPLGSSFGAAPADGSSIPLSQILDEGVYNGPDLYWSLSLRMYFLLRSSTAGQSKDLTTHNYLELGMRNYTNSFVMSNATSSVLIDKAENVSVQNRVYYMNYGMHIATYGKHPSTHNFFMGAGIRSSSYDAFQAQANPTGGPDIHSLNGLRVSVTHPTIHVGYELGFGLHK